MISCNCPDLRRCALARELQRHGRVSQRLGWWLLVLLAACVDEPLSATPPVPNRATFDDVIYPILARDCAFPACHAGEARFFRVFGPGRARLDPATGLAAPATAEEMDMAYDRARSMLAAVRAPEESLLLRKPLEIDRGGAAHMGVDQYGRDVYASREDPSYVALLQWAEGAAGSTGALEDAAP
jgi:hypothetical protein